MTLINKFLNFGFSAVVALAVSSCAEETFDVANTPFAQPGDRAETFEVPLRLHTDKPSTIGKPLVNEITSRAGEDADTEDPDDEVADPEKAAEEKIVDIWVFQYDNKGNQLIAPRFYEVSSMVIKELNIRLAEGEDSHVYVLANTGDPDWAKDKDLSTVEKFVAYEYPFTEDNVEMGEDEYLLMEGNVKETIKKETDLLPVDIHLTRMMAKVSFKYVTSAEASGLVVTRIIIHNMPEMMRMEETPIEENYPSPNDEDFATRSVTIDKKLASNEIYTFYMPANRRGVSENTDPALKNNGAPEKALYVQLFISSKTNGSSFLYTIYPGANDYNDYNVRRNHNYNITLQLNSEKRDDRVLAAPANCFVLDTKDEIMFDPYTRTETGGGWNYSDYVNKKDPKKKIVRADIVWQQPNVIGDNTPAARATQGSLVYLDEYDRIHVKSGSVNGNALIAGYNEDNEIVWSWHIWVNHDKPAELAAAVPYYTFEWDGSGIKTSKGRVRKGRSLMKCNLGAIDPNRNTSQPTKTFGCVYQWGRKDPFPSSWGVTAAGGSGWNQGGGKSYNSTTCGAIHNNANKAITFDGTGKEDNAGRLFRTKVTSSQTGTIEYTVKNPTHFISSLISPTTAADNSGTLTDYVTGTDGDWYYGPGVTPVHADNLWGGSEFATAMQFKVNNDASTVISDNGATEKSIFDPCPAGWMVPPADMWLSFTIDGTNKNDGSTANYPNMNTIDTYTSNQDARGYRMCMSQTYKDGSVTVFFPSQGVRLINGNFNQIGFCGNYHTSTGGPGGRTNAFHMHTPSFMYPFETGYGYTRRAIGCSVRCVRDVDE
ncbi:MAG: DUF4906 domain-containing protein [Muribaculaceae bacterium]|nr:DUF4906 domain-containing protein [Muribaculaceae bacterium]